MPNTRNNSTADGPMLVEPFDSVEQDLWELVDAAIARSLKDGAAPDPILGPFSDYFSFLRSIQTNQGDLLRDALSILLRSAGLTVYTELHLPISEAAKQAVKSNLTGKTLKGSSRPTPVCRRILQSRHRCCRRRPAVCGHHRSQAIQRERGGQAARGPIAIA